MRRSSISGQPRASLAGYWLAPILVGLGYGLARTLAAGLPWSGFHAQSPFVLAFFSGLLMAFAMRPVLIRIPWSRGAAFALSLAVLLALGPPAIWLLAALAELLGLAPFPRLLPRSVLPEVVALPAGAALMALFFRPAERRVTLADLWARLALRRPAAWAWRLSLLAALAVALWLVVGWATQMLSRGPGGVPGGGFPELTPLNAWSQLAGAGFNGAGGPAQGSLRAGGLLFLYWLRALALFGALLPIALVLRARWGQITLVFALLLFIVGDFAPLMMDQPYPSTPWLLARTALGAGRAFLLAGAAALLIGQLNPKD